MKTLGFTLLFSFYLSIAVLAQGQLTFVGNASALLRSDFIDLNGTSYAIGQTPSGLSLYTFDGQNLQLAPGQSDIVFQSINQLQLQPYRGSLYFITSTSTISKCIFAYDGSTVTQVPASGTAITLAVLRDTLYFSSNDGKVYYYTGSGSPILAANLSDMSNYFAPVYLAATDEYIFYHGTSFTNGNEILRFNGRSGEALEINPGSGDGFSTTSDGTFLKDGIFYFAGTDPTYGTELWKVEGNAAPQRLTDINQGGDGLLPYAMFAALGDTIYFGADDGTSGNELWGLDCIHETVFQVKDINPSGDSSPDYFYPWNGQLFFVAGDATGDRQLWSYDPYLSDPFHSYNGGVDAMEPNLLFTTGGSFYTQYDNYYAIYRFDYIATGVEDAQSLNDEPVLYPNPLKSDAPLFLYSHEKIEEVRLFDISGKEVYRGQSLPIVHQSGFYTVEITQHSKRTVQRLLVE